MAALTAIALAVSAAAAVGSYAQQRSAAKKQVAAAKEQRLADSLEAQANQMAGDSATRRDQAAALVKQNEELAASQLKENADATIADEEPAQARKRRVQAQFNLGGVDSAASPGSTGSISV